LLIKDRFSLKSLKHSKKGIKNDSDQDEDVEETKEKTEEVKKSEPTPAEKPKQPEDEDVEETKEKTEEVKKSETTPAEKPKQPETPPVDDYNPGEPVMTQSSYGDETFFEELYRSNLGNTAAYIERCNALRIELSKLDKRFVD
jgi:hypothetical protein